MAAMTPLEYRILIARGDEAVEVGRVELPLRAHRDGTVTVSIAAYRRRMRSAFRKIARAF